MTPNIHDVIEVLFSKRNSPKYKWSEGQLVPAEKSSALGCLAVLGIVFIITCVVVLVFILGRLSNIWFPL
jgi:hypothetical protein